MQAEYDRGRAAADALSAETDELGFN